MNNLGQLFILGFNGKEFNEELDDLIEKYNPGGLIFFKRNIPGTREKLKNLISEILLKYKKKSYPQPFIAIDHEGGRVHRLGDLATHFPAPGDMNLLSEEELFQVFQQQGNELAFFGFNMVFSPVLDLCNKGSSGAIGDRSFGSDFKFAIPRILQAGAGLEKSGIISVPKHFPGHGDVNIDPHFKLPVINKTIDDFEAYDLLPFRAVIENGAKAIMSAHVLTPKIDKNLPATLSKIWIDHLRQKMNFQGVIVTDDLCMKAIWGHNPIGIISQRVVEAGLDMICICFNDGEYSQCFQDSYSYLQKAFDTDNYIKNRINDSLIRIEKLKKSFSNIKTFDNENIFVKGHDFYSNIIKPKC